MIELILGGARSGKSRYAELQAIQSAKQVIYIATAEAGDDEMQFRIQKHQNSRPQSWETIEEPVQLAKTLQENGQKNTCVLVDCLTLWLTNILFDKQGKLQLSVFEQQSSALFSLLSNFSGHVIFVTNEIGLGVVPMDKMSRKFVDEAGLLHQKIASLSDKVVLVTAGLPQILKE